MFVKLEEILEKRYPEKVRGHIFNLRVITRLFSFSPSFLFFSLRLISFFARVKLWDSIILSLNEDIFTSEQMAFPSELLLPCPTWL